MHQNYYFLPLAAAVALSMAVPAKAATPLLLGDMTFTHVQEKFHVKLPGLIPNQKVSDSLNALEFIKKNMDRNQINHIRMQQTYAGMPVYGGYAILHASAREQLNPTSHVFMNGTLYEGLQDELGVPVKDFDKKAQLVLEKFKKNYRTETISNEQILPIVYIDEMNTAHWAYKVSLRISQPDNMPELQIAILDAETLKPFISWNDMKTETVPVKGMGYGGNPKMGKLQYGKGALAHLEMERDHEKGTCYLQSTDVKIVDLQGTWDERKRTPMRFKCNDMPAPVNGETIYSTGYGADGYDRANSAYNPTNDAAYAGYVIKHMYQDWYGMDALTKHDGSPMQLVMRVHFGSSYENAYWDSEEMHMTFGDGGSMFYPLVSLGVSAHEVSHGFTQQHANLEYRAQSGGMNESFSDMAAQAAEFYALGKGSWLIGAEIVKPDSGMKTLRYMDVPSKDGRSIDSADKYRPGMDVHYSSGVYNRMFYLLSTMDGWDIRSAFDVMVKANADYWTPNTNFKDGGCGVLNAAQDLNMSMDDVKKALTKVAIDHSGCMMHTLPIED